MQQILQIMISIVPNISDKFLEILADSIKKNCLEKDIKVFSLHNKFDVENCYKLINILKENPIKRY